MAHAQGTGVPVAGRKWEGVGETLELSGLPAAETLEELSDKIAEIVREPKLEERLQELSRKYAEQYSFYNQAKKHLALEEAILNGGGLPVLDGEAADERHTRKIGHRRFTGFGESRGGLEVHS
jgi:hypothetical protein